MTDARDSLRRIRSAGDVPASSTVRSPEPVRFQSSRHSESFTRRAPDANLRTTVTISVPRGPNSAGLVIERARSTAPIPEHSDIPLTVPTRPPPAPAAAALPAGPHDVSLHGRIMTFFGYGRSASRARKQLVSLCYNVAWGFVQIVLIVTMLSIGAHTESKTMPGMNEWVACDRPLAAWNCIYIVRVAFSSTLTYWSWRRDRDAHANPGDVENTTGSSRPMATAPTAQIHSPSGPHPNNNNNSQDSAPEVTLPHSVLYSRLSLLSSLFTLTWFLTAHILEYTSIHTCRFSSPHIWWLTFGILCIMYLVVLEVILLGFVVFVVAPIVFLVWNICLMLLGRHPMQNPGMIRPDVAKLSPSVVDRIPLVMYIPPPPDAAPGSIPLPEAVYSASNYPPKPAPPPVQRKHRFKFLRRSKKAKNASSGSSAAVRKPEARGEPQTWEDHWEQTGYPFVMLEGNRAACAICLMDFEEPKRIAGQETSVAPTESSSTAIQEIPVEPNNSPGDDENPLKLEDAGEGAQPLRLLACGHVFHKTCLDPWLTDVSGRCPVCQRPVVPPQKPNKKRSP